MVLCVSSSGNRILLKRWELRKLNVVGSRVHPPRLGYGLPSILGPNSLWGFWEGPGLTFSDARIHVL